MKNKYLLVLVILSLIAFKTNAQRKGLVAVFVSCDEKNVKKEYVRLLQSDMEQGLIDCGYSIVEHNAEYQKMIQSYNDYLRESSVSEFDFDKVESEKLADKILALYIMKLEEGSYRIEATMTDYGRTDSKDKKIYPSLGMGKCNLDNNPTDKITLATIELLHKLGLSEKAAHEEMINEYNKTLNQKKNKMNGKAFAASLFIPGVGQMIKHKTGSGCAFLLSEMALGGGVITTKLLADKKLKILTDRKVDYRTYNSAKKDYNNLKLINNICFWSLIAVHAGNIIHATLVKPKFILNSKKSNNKKNSTGNIDLYPTTIYSPYENNMAVGLGCTIKF